MSFATMKKNSKKTLAQLSEKIAKLKSGGDKSYVDEREWKLTRDKTGNGHATIRFLPCVSEETVPWVDTYSHGFQGPGGQWYIEDCPTTISKDCPICVANSALWNSGLDEDKELARKRKRKLSYYSNILVVDDPANPDNNGKVFLFRYGAKIFEKIDAVMSPEFDDIEPANPFDMFNGMNFKLRVKIKDKFPNYDLCTFDAPSPVDKNEKVMEGIYNQLYKLRDYHAESNFKSYDELETRFNKVVNGVTVRKTAEDADEDDTPTESLSAGRTECENTSPIDDAEDADAMEFFQSMADNS